MASAGGRCFKTRESREAFRLHFDVKGYWSEGAFWGITRYALSLLLALLLGIGAVRAEAARNGFGVVETKLPNGLTVLTKEDHAAPVVCTYVWYRVGSRDEVPGLTGISHQLEHMMFKGTKQAFPHPGYIDLLVGRHGGENNAETTTDFTAYYLLLPSDQLDLALRIEADRMTQAAINPKQLTAEKTVVLSELEGGNNDNASFLYDNVRATAFQYHPYHYPIIGTKWDVQHFTRQEVYAYYRAHYAPNNATLVIVGDFHTPALLKRVRELWQEVKPFDVPKPRVNPEPPQRGERRVIIRRAGATAYLELMFHIPAATHRDQVPLAVLATALGDGRSSRLYRALVETQLATSVSASASQSVDPDVFDISASARSGIAPETVEKALLAELARVQAEPLNERELQKAKNQTRADFVYAQDSVEQQAGRLGFYATVTGDWRNVTTYLDRINRVTAADARRVAQTYLKSDNRTVGTFLPNGEAPTPGSDSGGGGHTAHYRKAGNWVIGSLGNWEKRSQPTAWLQPFDHPIKGNGKREKGKAVNPITPLPNHPTTQLPTMSRHLANGLTVIVRENHANPTVSLGGFVRVGSVDDPAGKFGLASLVAEMLTRGTMTRTSQQIAEETDFVGASLGASSARERTRLGGKMLAENFAAMLGLLADCVRNPSFPGEELEKTRGETVTALREEANNTTVVASRRLYTALYPKDSAFPHAPIGALEDVERISRDDLDAFYHRYYRPERTVLVIVGDVKAETAFAEVEKAFGDWKGEGEAPPLYAPAPVTQPPVPTQPIVVTLPDKEQGDIAMGLLGLSRKSPDYEAAQLMNLILGGDPFVGRVGKRVRDTEGLAYYAYTDFVSELAVGPWVFRAGVNPRNILHALASARDEIRKMVAKGVTAEELAWAKDHSIGALRLSLATNQGMASELEEAMFYGLGLDYAERYPQIIRRITKAQVDAAARKYLHPNELAVVIAGPPIPVAATR